jgi:hypothetical protein
MRCMVWAIHIEILVLRLRSGKFNRKEEMKHHIQTYPPKL